MRSVFEIMHSGERYDTKRTIFYFVSFPRPNNLRSINLSSPSKVGPPATWHWGRTRKKHRSARGMIQKNMDFNHLIILPYFVLFVSFFLCNITFVTKWTHITQLTHLLTPNNNDQVSIVTIFGSWLGLFCRMIYKSITP